MIDFGREICGDASQAAKREWLVTNGIGGYASSTISGEITRRYQGLLVAALNPPVDRALMVSKLEETIDYDGNRYPLTTNRWGTGEIHPHGYLHIERFRLDGSIATWTFAVADALIEKRVWMEQGENTVYVKYRVARARRPVVLTVSPLINYRSNHSVVEEQDRGFDFDVDGETVTVQAGEDAVPYRMSMSGASFDLHQEWQADYFLTVDDERGVHPHEGHLLAGTFSIELEFGDETLFVASSEAAPADIASALDRHVSYERMLIDKSGCHDEPEAIRRLVLAADQFIVRRTFDGDPDGRSIIAGYPWFEDWGRDTMIALPGLTLVTGRPEIARRIILTYAAAESQGMLPNRFPEDGSDPVYNTIDATPWFFEAVRAYVAATGDTELLAEVFPVLHDMVQWHEHGTRYGIRFDPRDGLLAGTAEGAPLTWMDARMDDFVPTPRVGKPVEVNALWYNALCSMADFASMLEQNPQPYVDLAERLRDGFRRFWNDDRGYLFDVLDGPEGNDPSLRPNQIFAVSLSHSPLPERQQQAVIDWCARHLVTSHGLRSLAPDDDKYLGRYSGDLRMRDAAYHQGTVWSWLIGPFISAHLRVHNNPQAARSYLHGLFPHLKNDGLGSVSEIFDAEPPFKGRGCIAQAWGVAEILRVWKETEE